jgi:hypothetical protein
MPQVIQCPSCYASLQLPEQYLGQTVQCAQCQASFLATAVSAVRRSERAAWDDEINRPHREEGYPSAAWSARAAVTGPAIGLMIASILGLVGALLFVAVGVFLVVMTFIEPPRRDEWIQIVIPLMIMFWGPGIFGLIWSFVVLIGSLKMKNLSSRGWAMTATCLSLVTLALPLGIWALIVLNKPDVKEAFR